MAHTSDYSPHTSTLRSSKGTQQLVSNTLDITMTTAEQPSTTPSAPSHFQRFMKFGRRNTGRDEGFPPAHWSHASPGAEAKDATPGNAPAASVEITSSAQTESKASSNGGHELDNHVATVDTNGTAVESGETDTEPEPATLASKIHSLLLSLPPLSSSQASAANAGAKGSTDTIGGITLPSFLADSKLMTYLSSPSVMNGSVEKGKQSVWALLDRFKANMGKDTVPAEGQMPTSDAQTDDDASVMFYGPLEPDDSSFVEVARSEVSMDEGEAVTIEEQQMEDASSRVHFGGTLPFFRKGKGKATGPGQKAVERKVWVPSKEKISLEIRWWGYRIYLPPPVLDVLDSSRMENTKRAAILTTALKWLLDHIPMAAVPLQVRPAMPLLRTVVPYLGYVGAFVAWSWDAIKSYDKGNGVVLTATWLLTFALVPGTWEDSQHVITRPPHMSET
ncbi:uncharacterized protein LAESUDRAFT_762855 [Laetiporus sulphureus 93-53]|uniref:Uncharacterized protein n=1 Tax=Laetiporus sulphureus 93-53 TaxID=1314785 RepID=A0A165CBK1_9APHY|nr:uncharacterized protein LAESUDRAFT_762855 [Laetiporus sulphureus 93-53]KZT02511.1 hypothetical protein LAESUDRAFT_762855 [Laetiporus sulphureus 93-53]